MNCRILVSSLVLSAVSVAVVPLPVAAPQVKQYALVSVEGLRLHNVSAEPATLQQKQGLRLTISADAARRLANMTAEQQAEVEQLAIIDGVEFTSGVIEAEIAGTPAAGAAEGARGFVGIAFRLHNDLRTYDAFYLRPTNGRAEDQERRNHALQYVSHPDWPWFRLRKETPSRYESYADLLPGEWTKIRIDVRDERARLYVHGQPQPALIVNDIKSGAQGKGGVALWLGPGTVAHFRNLRLTHNPPD